MKNILLTITFVFLCFFLKAEPTLTFKLDNPRIIFSSYNYIEFDIMFKSSESGSYFYSGQVNLNFNNSAFGSTTSYWIVYIDADSFLDGENLFGDSKYSRIRTLTGTPTVLNIGITSSLDGLQEGPGADFFNEVPTSFTKLFRVRARITSGIEIANIDFAESIMNAKCSYITAANTTEIYESPNLYETKNFNNLNIERIYSNSSWSQIGGTVDWSTSVNTSIWDGNASIPATGESLISSLRVHDGANLTVPKTGM